MFNCRNKFNFEIMFIFETNTKKIILYDHEKQYVNERIHNVVINKFRHKQILHSIVLFEIDVNTKILFYDIILTFDLIIDLKMKNRKKNSCYFQRIT